ncbi:MAG: hypothetical protein DDT26_02566 [Dehalococcoidia bacterium]|nr:hypothetical protein [Chloroflexota bacterium]
MTEPLSQVSLADLSPPDKPWDGHRKDATLISLNFAKGGLERYSQRIEQCSRRLAFAQQELEAGKIGLKLYAAKFCRVRLCPVCQWRKQLMWRARFFKALPQYLADHETYVPLLLTLTLRNCEITELRSTVDHLQKSFQRLIQRKAWPARGFVRSLEVTRNPDTGQAHPHLHVLMFVRRSYFKGKGYIKHAEWVEMWRQCLQVDYPPNLDIRRIKNSTENDSVFDLLTAEKGGGPASNNLMKAVCETLKYSVKPSDLTTDHEWLAELASQLHNLRAIAVGGDLKDYMRDDEPEDLIHGDEEEIPDLSEYQHIIFDWAEDMRRYILGRQY